MSHAAESFSWVEEPEDVDVLLSAALQRVAEKREAGRPDLREWMDVVEAWRIAHALRESRGNRSAAARALGIGRRTLYTKIARLGIL
jgi:DNA-binding NtrC family response regulator